MTMLAPAPLLPNLVENYSVAWLLYHDRPRAMRAVKRGLQKVVDDAMPHVEMMAKAMGVRPQSDDLKVFVWFHVGKYSQTVTVVNEVTGLPETIDLWEMQRRRFPKRHARDWERYQDLRARVEAGEFRADGAL